MLTSSKRKTQTPTIEAGGVSRRSSLSSDDDQAVALHAYPTAGDDEDGDIPHGRPEQEQLLRRGVVQHLDAQAGHKHGWINIFGFSLPKPLAYVFSLPPIIILLSLITRFFAPGYHLAHPLLNNGTNSYHPTTLLISLDGFRASYISSHPDLLPNILSLANSTHGLRAESMQPVFPTLTFPNHWALMTGLYPESHGIVANSFWDPQFDVKGGSEFFYTDHEKSWNGLWWWGEPLWSVVERVGRKSGVIMWPGPPVTSAGVAPSYFVPYKDMAPPLKLHQVFEWLDLPLASRPEFIAAYFPDIDQEGHEGGPDSAEVNGSLSRIDDMVGDLVAGLKQRNLTDIVDVVIVSDHGMASTSNMRLVYLDDILDADGVDAIEHKDGWPSVGLRFKAGTDTDFYLNRLLEAAENSNGTFAVYTHETMPERWHFSKGHRIAPIYLVPKIGWAITDHHEHEVINEGDYQPKGNHGYDNTEPEMQAIFLAHGPFVKALKNKGAGIISADPPVIESFRNLEIFSLVTTLLGINSAEPLHNGTIGFWDKYL